MPVQTYTKTSIVGQGGVNKLGFEIATDDNSGIKIDTLILADAIRTSFVNGINGVSHTSDGNTPKSLNTNTWTFDWIVPAAVTGDVTFYGTFNAANSNSTSQGDQVYTKSLIITEGLATGIEENLSQADLTYRVSKC